MDKNNNNNNNNPTVEEKSLQSGPIFELTGDLFYYSIFPILSNRSIISFGQTCRYFRKIIRHPRAIDSLIISTQPLSAFTSLPYKIKRISIIRNDTISFPDLAQLLEKFPSVTELVLDGGAKLKFKDHQLLSEFTQHLEKCAIQLDLLEIRNSSKIEFASLYHLPPCTRLFLKNNSGLVSVSSLPQGALADKTFPTVKELDLRGCYRLNESSQYLFFSLLYPNLETIHFHRVNDRSLDVFLTKCLHIKHLNIRSSPVFRSQLISNLPLETLRIGFCTLDIQDIIPKLVHPHLLTTLDCQGKAALTDLLPQLTRHCPSLTSLDLRDTTLIDFDKHLGPLLMECELRELWIRASNLSDLAIDAISQYGHALTLLSLEECPKITINSITKWQSKDVLPRISVIKALIPSCPSELLDTIKINHPYLIYFKYFFFDPK